MISAVMFIATFLTFFLISTPMEEKKVKTTFTTAVKHVEANIAQYKVLTLWDRFTMLFFVNFEISLFAIAYGFLFGIGTLYFIGITPAYLGIFTALWAKKGYAGVYLLGAILPHGIFEIPAILLSGALGLRLGRNIFYMFVSVFKKRKIKKEIWKEYHMLIMDAGVIIFICFLLLLFAAFLEVYVTPHWINYVCSTQGLKCTVS